MVRFLHAADLHLDSPFSGLREIHSELPRVLADATLKAFTRLVDLALRERVDFVALAGDLYDRKDRSLRARLHLQKETQRLHEGGIRTFIVHGNHDPLSQDPGGLNLAPSVKVFGSSWEEVAVPARDGRGAYRVQGISFLEAVEIKNLSQHFSRQGEEPTIALLHTNVGDAAGHANYAPCTLEDLGAARLDYWALGHVHTRAEYLLAPRGRAVYPGNLQGRNARELGARGAVLATIDESHAAGSHPVSTRFVALDSVRWHLCEVSLQGLLTLDALTEACLASVRQAVSPEVDGHMVRVRLTGRGQLHAQLRSADALSSLQESWQQELVAQRVWLESIDNASRPAVEIERIRETDGLLAGLAGYCAQGVPAEELNRLLKDEVLLKLDAQLIAAGLPGLTLQAQSWAHDAAWRAIDHVAGEDI